MRLRFSLRMLLALPFVIGFAIMWWTWPDRTFEEFKAAIAAEQFDVANSLVRETPGTKFEIDATGIRIESRIGTQHSRVDQAFGARLIPEDRSLADVLLARRSFKSLMKDPGFSTVNGVIKMCEPTLLFTIVVERGELKLVDPIGTEEHEYQLDPALLGR